MRQLTENECTLAGVLGVVAMLIAGLTLGIYFYQSGLTERTKAKSQAVEAMTAAGRTTSEITDVLRQMDK